MKIPEATEQILEWACENYLPDYYELFNELQKRCSKYSLSAWEREKSEFLDSHFPEALTAFAEQVAKEQRELCADNADLVAPLIRANCGLGSEYYQIDRDSILSAPSPITKE